MGYIPHRGDIVWLHFDPQSGHEQAGHRLALVLSPKKYNKLTRLMLCCPLTTTIKGYPFEVETLINNKAGAALSDQVKSLDWQTRRAKKAGTVKISVLDEVLEKLETLLW